MLMMITTKYITRTVMACQKTSDSSMAYPHSSLISLKGSKKKNSALSRLTNTSPARPFTKMIPIP